MLSSRSNPSSKRCTFTVGMLAALPIQGRVQGRDRDTRHEAQLQSNLHCQRGILPHKTFTAHSTQKGPGVWPREGGGHAHFWVPSRLAPINQQAISLILGNPSRIAATALQETWQQNYGEVRFRQHAAHKCVVDGLEGCTHLAPGASPFLLSNAECRLVVPCRNSPRPPDQAQSG